MRQAWRYLSALALLMACASMLLSAVLFGRVNDRADDLKVTAEQIRHTAEELARTAKEGVRASRAGCRRDNVVRENQAANFKDQIDATEQSLRGPLGPALEPFRAQILRQNNQRRKRLRQLIPIPPDRSLPGRPYALNCRVAYPFAPRPR